MGDSATESNAQLCCESCGEKDAASMEFTHCVSIGVPPRFGYYKEHPTHRFLCHKHAASACLWHCFKNSLFGCWGFPGIFLAPVRTWGNIRAVKERFTVGFGFTAVAMTIGTFPAGFLAILIGLVLARS